MDLLLSWLNNDLKLSKSVDNLDQVRYLEEKHLTRGREDERGRMMDDGRLTLLSAGLLLCALPLVVRAVVI
jgi:hypothetical protein